MATAAISGKTGPVTGAGSASEVTEWSVTLTEAVLEATSFDGDGWEESIPGLKGGTGSLSGKGTVPSTGAAAALALGNSAGGVAISGEAIFGTVTPTNAVGDVLSYSADFTFTGEVTVA